MNNKLQIITRQFYMVKGQVAEETDANVDRAAQVDGSSDYPHHPPHRRIRKGLIDLKQLAEIVKVGRERR